MKKSLTLLSKKVSQVLGLALAAIATNESAAMTAPSTSSESVPNSIDFVANKSARKTIPVLKLTANNTAGKFVANHGSHSSHRSHSSHSSHRSSSFVY